MSSRALAMARGVYGAGLLAAPIRPRGTRWFCRILGVRQVGEAVVLRRASRQLLLAGAAVDVVHAASVLWLARRRPRHARGLHANAATAGTLAVASLLCAGRRA